MRIFMENFHHGEQRDRKIMCQLLQGEQTQNTRQAHHKKDPLDTAYNCKLGKNNGSVRGRYAPVKLSITPPAGRKDQPEIF